jgi:hypothetical protein
MPSGHVAVVSRVVSTREILVDHANWYRGRVTRGMSVIDDSPGNDWSSVSVLDLASGKHGRDNPASGFVYPQTGPHDGGGISFASYTPSSSEDWRATSGLVHFAVLTEGRHSARHRGKTHAKSARHHQGAHAAASSSHSGHAAHKQAAHTVKSKSKTSEAKHHRA